MIGPGSSLKINTAATSQTGESSTRPAPATRMSKIRFTASPSCRCGSRSLDVRTGSLRHRACVGQRVHADGEPQSRQRLFGVAATREVLEARNEGQERLERRECDG